MNRIRGKSPRRSQDGVALLIAIFVLLLISVVAIALLVSSGTETALGANYRSSSTVYYAALAGLEEARGRLSPKNPDYLTANSIPSPFPLTEVFYITNPLPNETVAPADPTNLYYDKEYANEFTTQASAVPSLSSKFSVWYNNPLGIPGPVYKWVRITAATQHSLNLNVDSTGSYDPHQLVYYDPAQVNAQGNPTPSLIVPTGTPPTTAVQVLQITALAYLPNGSQKLLQYVVYPTAQSLNFPAALTLDGPNAGLNTGFGVSQMVLPWGSGFAMSGNDLNFSPSGGGCANGPNPNPVPVRAIGYSNTGGGDQTLNNINHAMAAANPGTYTGLDSPPTPPTPDVFYVGSSAPPGFPTLDPNFQTLPAVNSLVTAVSQQADVTLTGSVYQSDSNNVLPAAMSAINPMTVVVNGDFDTSNWTGTGYGLLLVTGVFTYDAHSSWDGVILVIGKGVFSSSSGGGATGQINGTVLLANTVDSHGNPLSSLGSPAFSFLGYGNASINYSSCWIQVAQTASKYQVLSFREIPQN